MSTHRVREAPRLRPALLMLLVLSAPVASASLALPLLAPPLLADVPGGDSVALGAQGSIVVGTGAFLRKFDAHGILLWERAVPAARTWLRVAVDAQDRVFAASEAVSQYAPDGVLRWTVTLPTPALGLAVDDVGDAHVVLRNGSAQRWSPGGELEWTTSVPVGSDGGDGGDDAASAIATSHSGSWVAVATGAGITAFDAAAAVRWTSLVRGDQIAVDDDGTAYVSHVTGRDVLGDLGYVAKFDAQGTLRWTSTEPAPAMVLKDEELVVARPWTAAPGTVPVAVGFRVDAFRLGDHAWVWGFTHITGQALTPPSARASLAVRPGFLAMTARDLDTPLYTGDAPRVCDATPLVSTPDLARVCLFAPS